MVFAMVLKMVAMWVALMVEKLEIQRADTMVERMDNYKAAY